MTRYIIKRLPSTLPAFNFHVKQLGFGKCINRP